MHNPRKTIENQYSANHAAVSAGSKVLLHWFKASLIGARKCDNSAPSWRKMCSWLLLYSGLVKITQRLLMCLALL